LGIWSGIFFVFWPLVDDASERSRCCRAEPAALAGYPTAAYERDEDGWKKNSDPLSFTPEASHLVKWHGNFNFLVPIEGRVGAVA
jgi:hypothetical protein